MVLLMDGEFVKALRSAADAQQFMAVIDRFEKEKYPQEVGGTEQKPVEEKAGYRVLAVTACPVSRIPIWQQRHWKKRLRR